MKRFFGKHRDTIAIAAIVAFVVVLVVSLVYKQVDAARPDPNLSGRRIVTVLAHVDSDPHAKDETYYDVVKIDGVDVLYLKVYDLTDRYMVPWLKPDGTPMTYDEYQEVWP